MSELFMRAYYHTFQPTGELCADRILSAVARAGKSAHHTADWYDEWHNIQNAANATAEEVKNLRQRLAAAESELNRLRCAMNDEKVASGVLSAFWRRVYGAANSTAFDKQVLTAHMLTALSGIDIFSKRELAETVCPDCGPVSVNPDIFDNGIPIGAECPYCKDRLHFAPQTMSGEV